MRQNKYGNYDERFVHFSTSMERAMIFVIITLFFFLVISQGLLQVDAFRQWIVEVERLEGVAS